MNEHSYSLVGSCKKKGGGIIELSLTLLGVQKQYFKKGFTHTAFSFNLAIMPSLLYITPLFSPKCDVNFINIQLSSFDTKCPNQYIHFFLN